MYIFYQHGATVDRLIILNINEKNINSVQSALNSNGDMGN